MKNTNRKKSDNWLVCNMTGDKRMSNKTYITDKAYKNGIGSVEWKANYINKASLKRLTEVVAEEGFGKAAETYSVSTSQIAKWLRLNGRGKFVASQPQQLEKAA
tara:strand:- start:1818 stop:2129 length:312 start_codon:yes stop_codon:yes gene_type:complete